MPNLIDEIKAKHEKQLEERGKDDTDYDSKENQEKRAEELERVKEALSQPNPNISQGDSRPERPNRMNDFEVYGLTEEQQDAVDRVNNYFWNCAKSLDDLLPENRHKSVAFTNLEQTCMWAIKAITHSGK